MGTQLNPDMFMAGLLAAAPPQPTQPEPRQSPAARFNNPGNLREPSTGEYRQYDSPEAGFEGLVGDLEAKKTGKTTTGLHSGSSIYDFSSKYAPKEADNNQPIQHAQSIAQQLGVPPETPIGQIPTRDFAAAVAHAEDAPFWKSISGRVLGQPQNLNPDSFMAQQQAAPPTGVPAAGLTPDSFMASLGSAPPADRLSVAKNPDGSTSYMKSGNAAPSPTAADDAAWEAEPSALQKGLSYAKRVVTGHAIKALGGATATEVYDSAIEAARQLAEKVLGEPSSKTEHNLPGVAQTARFATTVGRGVPQILDFLMTPAGAATGLGVGVAPNAIQAAVGAGYSTDLALKAKVAIKEAHKDPTPETIGEAVKLAAMAGLPFIRPVAETYKKAGEAIESHNVEAERLVELERRNVTPEQHASEKADLVAKQAEAQRKINEYMALPKAERAAQEYLGERSDPASNPLTELQKSKARIDKQLKELGTEPERIPSPPAELAPKVEPRRTQTQLLQRYGRGRARVVDPNTGDEIFDGTVAEGKKWLEENGAPEIKPFTSNVEPIPVILKGKPARIEELTGGNARVVDQETGVVIRAGRAGDVQSWLHDQGAERPGGASTGDALDAQYSSLVERRGKMESRLHQISKEIEGASDEDVSRLGREAREIAQDMAVAEVHISQVQRQRAKLGAPGTTPPGTPRGTQPPLEPKAEATAQPGAESEPVPAETAAPKVVAGTTFETPEGRQVVRLVTPKKVIFDQTAPDGRLTRRTLPPEQFAALVGTQGTEQKNEVPAAGTPAAGPESGVSPVEQAEAEKQGTVPAAQPESRPAEVSQPESTTAEKPASAPAQMISALRKLILSPNTSDEERKRLRKRLGDISPSELKAVDQDAALLPTPSAEQQPAILGTETSIRNTGASATPFAAGPRSSFYQEEPASSGGTAADEKPAAVAQPEAAESSPLLAETQRKLTEVESAIAKSGEKPHLVRNRDLLRKQVESLQAEATSKPTTPVAKPSTQVAEGGEPAGAPGVAVSKVGKTLNIQIARQSESTHPVLDIHREPTGWLEQRHQDGTTLIHPTENVAYDFSAENPKSGTDLHRARAHAQAYAIDNPVEETPSKVVAGAKVSWTANGKPLTGTVRSIDQENGTASIDTDQIAHIAGRIPIGRVETVKLDRLTVAHPGASAENGGTGSAAAPGDRAPTKPEVKASEPEKRNHWADTHPTLAGPGISTMDLASHRKRVAQEAFSKEFHELSDAQKRGVDDQLERDLVAKAVKKQTPKQKVEVIRARRRDIYTPGNVVTSYGGGLDKVLSYEENANGGFTVKVQAVRPDGSIDPQYPDPRTHSTPPDRDTRVVERAATETKAPPTETKAPVTETKPSKPVEKGVVAEAKPLTPAEIDAAVLANLAPKAKSAREKFLARKSEGPVRSSVETPGERPAKELDPQDLEELGMMGAEWAVQSGNSYGRWSVRAAKELGEMGMLKEYSPYLRQIHERALEIVDAERDVVTAPSTTAEPVVEDRTAEAAEMRSTFAAGDRVESPGKDGKVHPDDRGTVLFANEDGSVTVRWDDHRQSTSSPDRLRPTAEKAEERSPEPTSEDRDTAHNIAVAHTKSIREEARRAERALANTPENAFSHVEKLKALAESGDEYVHKLPLSPDDRQDLQLAIQVARDLVADIRVPRSTPAKVEEPSRDMAEVETRLAESEVKLSTERRDYDKLLHLYDLATTTRKLRPEEEDEFTYAGFHVNDKGHAVKDSERTDNIRKALILAGRKFDAAAKAHDHALWTAAQDNPLLLLQPDLAIPSAAVPVDEEADKELAKSIEYVNDNIADVLRQEKRGDNVQAKYAADDVATALKLLREDIKELPHASRHMLTDADVAVTTAERLIQRLNASKPEPAPAPAQTPADESALIPEARQLIEAFRQLIRTGSARINNNINLMDYVKHVTGRSPGDGSFDTKQVYDILETAVNQEIAENRHYLMHAGNVPDGLLELRAMLAKLPTQAIRSDEQIRFQQFSTPPTEALVAARVLGIVPDDLVLEPSGGTAGLAAFAKAAGAKVITNEITPRRAALLRLSGYLVAEGDAEQIDNAYEEAFPGVADPTAVLMNPPFSAAGARGTANTNEVGYRHVLQALRRLQPGGRLVAILGEGARLDAPNARDFWQKVRDTSTVRANVGINGKEYAKYGTTFGNRIIVIDKVRAGVPQAPVTGDFDTLEEAWKTLAPIAADRIAISPATERLPQQPGAGVGHGAEGSGSSTGVGTPTGGVREPGGESGTSVRGGQRGSANTPGGHEAGTGSQGAPGHQPNLRPEDAGATDGTVGSGNADVSPTGPARSQLVKQSGEDIGDYVAYVPSGVPESWGAQPHNASIVETQTMASVPEPPLTMKPNIPQSVIKSGDLSAVQLATVAHTIQAHELFSKNGRRIGFFNGDGTGVGKGRTNAATAVHYWRTLPANKRRTVWISFNEELAEAARDDLDNVGGKQIPIYSLEKVKVGKTIPYKDGVLFVPYSKLAAQQNTKADGSAFKKGATKAERAAGQKQMRRLAQIMEWAGEEPLIIFDESQKAKNATTTETEIPGGAGQDSRKARQKPTATGLAAIEIQNKLPKARVLYSSATGFSDVSNMAYANRLDAWGEGTSFKDFEDFRQQVTQGGISMMEMVARNLKAEGKYLSRFISYKGVKFEEKTHEISSDQHKMLDKAGDAWRMVIDRFNAAAEATTGNADDGGNAKGSVKSAAMSQLYGAQLRFYRSLYTALKVPTLIRLIDEAMDAGKSVVISVLETGQAQQDRELQRVMQQDDEDLEGADLSPIAGLINMVDNRFPTIEYETVEDPDTHEKITRPVKYIDANGIERIRQNAEALLAKKELLDQLEKLKGEFPDAALDQILNKYGSQNVAEMTKRSERLVRNSQTGKREVQSRGSDLTKTNLHEMQAFQDGLKRIAIISNAASTGISLHSSIRAKNQQQRVHIMLQLKWSADMTLQDLGRTHRTAQVIPPEYVLLSLNVEAEKRFAATIARRLEQLGALSRGERKAGGGATDFSKYNFESRYGNYAVDQVVDQLFSGVDRFGFLTEDRMKQYPRLADGPAVLNMLGLHETDKDGNEVAPNVPVKRFFNRMMILPINMGNELFRAFFETMGHLIESAKRQGQFDEGAEKIKAKELVQDGEPIVVYENPTTHAQAVYYKLNAKNQRYRFSWDDARKKLADGYSLIRVKASGRLLFVGGVTTEFDSDTGSQRKFAWGNGASGTGARVPVDQIGQKEDQKYEEILGHRGSKEIQDEWQAQYDAAGPWVITPHHLITGSVLPIWGKIQEREGGGKNETVKPLVVKIGLLDSGERIIGVDVSGNRINKVLGALGHAVVARPEDVERQLMGGKRFSLAQGATLRRAQVSGNYRIELEGAAHFRRLFGQWGLFPETIASKERWFIPTGDRGMDVLKRVLKELPVTGADDEGPVRASREPSAVAGPVFYSQLERTIEAKMPARAPASMMLAIVSNPQNGVKQDELDWTGFADWLKEQKGTVSKQAALDFIHANQVQIQEVTKGNRKGDSEMQAALDPQIRELSNWPADVKTAKRPEDQGRLDNLLQRWEEAEPASPTKFGSHVLPGGENYRELLLTLPSQPFEPPNLDWKRNASGKWAWFADGKQVSGAFESEGSAEMARGSIGRDVRRNPAEYRGGHWTEPNVIAHVRMNDRVGPNGERILHMEENQSDWGQRKRGEREKIRAAIKNKWVEIVTRMKKDGKLKVICP